MHRALPLRLISIHQLNDGSGSAESVHNEPARSSAAKIGMRRSQSLKPQTIDRYLSGSGTKGSSRVFPDQTRAFHTTWRGALEAPPYGGFP